MPGQPSHTRNSQEPGCAKHTGWILRQSPGRQGRIQLPQKAPGQAQREGSREGNTSASSQPFLELPGQDSAQQVPGLRHTDKTPLDGIHGPGQAQHPS